MFSRVLVANRGEIAVRVIRALHELGIEAVAVYSTADRDALHVELADRAVCIGPPAAAESYLRIPNVIAAAETTGCEAVHPGYGFLAENPAFARACAENDLVFVGPAAEVMERLGDKARAKAEMRAAGVPLVPGTDGAAASPSCASGARDRLPGAAQGDGGRRREGHAARRGRGELEGAFAAAERRGGGGVRRRLALPREGVAPARHVEIQVLCDATAACSRSASASARSSGGTRSSSRSRRRRRSPPRRARRWRAPSSVHALAIGYRGAGTFEFLARARGRASTSSRSTAGSRSSTPSRSSSPESTSSASRSGSPPESRSRSPGARRGAGTRSRCGSTPRIRRAASRRRRARSRGSGRRSAPGVRVDTAIEDGERDPAVLRLDDREGDRPGRDAAGGDRARDRARSRSSRSTASRRRASSRSTSSPRPASGAASTRPATLTRWKAAFPRSRSQ